jgi:hypothetical protein
MGRINPNLDSFDKILQAKSKQGNLLNGSIAENNNIQFSG